MSCVLLAAILKSWIKKNRKKRKKTSMNEKNLHSFPIYFLLHQDKFCSLRKQKLKNFEKKKSKFNFKASIMQESKP